MYVIVVVVDFVGMIFDVWICVIDIVDGLELLFDMIFVDVVELFVMIVDGLLLVGVGIGVFGFVEYLMGCLINLLIMLGWDWFDILVYVQWIFDVLVFVDNDVNILVFGEQVMSWLQVDDLIFVKVLIGIGVGIIVGGQLQCGVQGLVGDMGYVQVFVGVGFIRLFGDECDLEVFVSGFVFVIVLCVEGFDV